MSIVSGEYRVATLARRRKAPAAAVARNRRRENNNGNFAAETKVYHAGVSNYSLLKADIGSTLAARRAGIHDATRAARLRMSVATAIIRGSHGETP